MAPPVRAEFCAGSSGLWRIDRVTSVVGEGLRYADRLDVAECEHRSPAPSTVWCVKGVTSNIRYTKRQEADTLTGVQEGLGRSQATRAALIPIRKNEVWWSLAQDERRSIFEEQSRHIGIGLDYLPAIARRLYHCRDLGEPFDFLTWFEFAPENCDAFEALVVRLRSTTEWRFVDREVDIRLSR